MGKQAILDFYTHPGAMTFVGRHVSLFDGLPRDVPALVRIVQGLAVHEYVASPFYGFTIPNGRKSESHIRTVEQMLDRIMALDDRPLTIARPPDKRLVGVCHHFTLLLVAILRAKGIPARARYGFGAYFNPGVFEDHSLCEYWNAADRRWALVDPQFDEVWRARLKITHDILDVPRDRFIIPGDAWAQCRTGAADPSRFGMFKGELRGLWFVAGNLVRDLAALNKMEMLQWDVWGAMVRSGEQFSDGQLAFFDRLAAFSRAPDASFKELRMLYRADDYLRVPAVVFNGVLNRSEAVWH